jgi:hypothetical protein
MLIEAASMSELRCSNGPPAFAGAESGFAGVTINLVWRVCRRASARGGELNLFSHPCAGRDPCERSE